MKKNEARVKVGIKLTENMIYNCDLGQINMDDLFIDETRKKRTDRIGPSPTKLLALSVLGCLAACFEFCLQKKGFTLSDLDGRAEVTFIRKIKEFWRIKKIDVELLPKIDNP
ncbi:MAG: OsmC family protein, partial [Candidatus Lokiarchaeota archaeon]|nr:OsmC family protein [Candidatus Lokiarchaeota archaeon]